MLTNGRLWLQGMAEAGAGGAGVPPPQLAAQPAAPPVAQADEVLVLLRGVAHQQQEQAKRMEEIERRHQQSRLEAQAQATRNYAFTNKRNHREALRLSAVLHLLALCCGADDAKTQPVRDLLAILQADLVSLDPLAFSAIDWERREAEIASLLRAKESLAPHHAVLAEMLRVPVDRKRRSDGEQYERNTRQRGDRAAVAAPTPTVVFAQPPAPMLQFGYPSGMASAAMTSLPLPQQHAAFAAHQQAAQQQAVQSQPQFLGGFAPSAFAPSGAPFYPATETAGVGQTMALKAVCSHCRMSSHSEKNCWILHPELRDKRHSATQRPQ